jgi:hypothetical protein
MKRLVTVMSCALFASLVASGCKKPEANKDEAAMKDEAATKPAEAAKPAADPAAAPAAPAATDPAAAPADPHAAMGTAPAAPSVAPVEPPADEKALAEKAVVMLEEMAKVAEANAADCGKAAASLQGIVDKNKGLIEAGKKMDNDPGKKAWFEQNYQSRMMGAMGKMVPLMDKCKDNPELLKVFTSMQ